jgi:hypothetical protein
MENQISISAEELKRELERTIHLWVERTFNFIQVGVLNKYCDNTLYDYIRNPSLEEAFDKWITEFSDNDSEEKIIKFFKEGEYYHEGNCENIDIDLMMNNYRKQFGSIKESFILVFSENNWDSFKEWCCEEEYENDIYDWIHEQENYPMWNTCFEFRDSFYNSEEDIEKCMSVGLGVIDGLEDFNVILFMSSAGHSFYSAYWIPLYFKLFPTEAEKYAGINYSDL